MIVVLAKIFQEFKVIEMVRFTRINFMVNNVSKSSAVLQDYQTPLFQQAQRIDADKR